jgi:hypothetical protein
MTNVQWIILVIVLGLSFIGFFTLIWLGYANNKHLDKGEMRKAITAFFVLLFGSLITSSFFPTGINLPGEVKGIFAGTITTLIGFYFGARTASTSSKNGN